jgi:hypothetical protein
LPAGSLPISLAGPTSCPPRLTAKRPHSRDCASSETSFVSSTSLRFHSVSLISSICHSIYGVIQMAHHRITCTIQAPFNQPRSHAHIVRVGTESNAGCDRIWLVHEVYAAMDQGERFYTYSPSANKVAWVRKYQCVHADCQFNTLRSDPNAVPDNNLDNLPTCRTA